MNFVKCEFCKMELEDLSDKGNHLQVVHKLNVINHFATVDGKFKLVEIEIRS